MSNYPVWWDTTVTIYNQYTDPVSNKITWFRHVITGCFWKNESIQITLGNTAISANSTICRIRKQDNYLDRYSWAKLPNDQMGNYLTLGRGDILIKGEVEDEIDEYAKGKHANDLLIKYKDLEYMKAEEFTINVGAGRCEEHYLVRGK